MPNIMTSIIQMVITRILLFTPNSGRVMRKVFPFLIIAVGYLYAASVCNIPYC